LRCSVMLCAIIMASDSMSCSLAPCFLLSRHSTAQHLGCQCRHVDALLWLLRPDHTQLRGEIIAERHTNSGGMSNKGYSVRLRT
jgi:hypothetical protein